MVLWKKTMYSQINTSTASTKHFGHFIIAWFCQIFSRVRWEKDQKLRLNPGLKIYCLYDLEELTCSPIASSINQINQEL